MDETPDSASTEPMAAAQPEADGGDSQILRISEAYFTEADDARKSRLNMNRMNWDMYHLNQDFSHKRPGQSREVLAKQAMAVEQITEFFQQGLIDIDDWWRCDYKQGVDPSQMPITNLEIKTIVDSFLDKLDDDAGFLPFVADCVKSGLLGSLIIVKVHGRKKKKSVFSFEQKVKDPGRTLQPHENPELTPVLKRGFKTEWELQLDLIEPFCYGVDPSSRKLFEFQDAFVDFSDVAAMAKGEDAVYDMKVVEECKNQAAEEYKKEIDRARETDQPIPTVKRNKIKIREFWGTIVDNITGEVLHENVVWTIANDRHLIQKPTPNPWWHGKSPFVVSPIIRVPKSQWHKALMDAPTLHNKALNEIYNLILDSGMMAAYGLKQYRPDYMEDESSAAEGFAPGQSIAVSSDCPPGMKVVEQVATGSMSQESLSVYNLTNAEFNAAALTNDLRMGAMPDRAVKATEVVFTGIAKVLEIAFIQRTIERSWESVLQNADNLDSPEMQALLGTDRAIAIGAISPQERFAKCIQGTAFNVFGVSKTLAKVKDFKKLTALLQTISGDPILMQEFAQEYSPVKLLQQIMAALDINTTKLEMTPEEKQATQQRIQQGMAQKNQQSAGGNIGSDQSQIPQATTGNENPQPQAGIPKLG
jgi:hypothetical protein